MEIDGKAPEEIATLIADRLPKVTKAKGRSMIAVAGPPASGKSTLAEVLVAELRAQSRAAGLLTMDGFHLDNAILETRGLRQRKGAPETFDLDGFHALASRVAHGEHVYVPAFDRDRDLSVNAAREIGTDIRLVVVEGNYLLLDEPGWRDLRDLWDFTVFLDIPRDILKARLLARWKSHGLPPEEGRAKVMENDLPNATRVVETVNRDAVDLILTSGRA